MNVIIVSHPSRQSNVRLLQEHLNVVATVVDTVSAWSGHRCALRLACEHSERVVIMEDDAIPVQGFNGLAQAWCDALPDDLISFYLGTTRPRTYQPLVNRRIVTADHQGELEIRLPTLIHGVCYSVPPHAVTTLCQRLDALSRIVEADYAVGAAWGKEVVYPIESLVQHRDDQPVERLSAQVRSPDKRVARKLAAELMFNPT